MGDSEWEFGSNVIIRDFKCILIDWLNETSHLETDRRRKTVIEESVGGAMSKKRQFCHLPTAGASYSSPSSISGAEYASEPQLVINMAPG